MNTARRAAASLQAGRGFRTGPGACLAFSSALAAPGEPTLRDITREPTAQKLAGDRREARGR